jgi:hypothetical protein
MSPPLIDGTVAVLLASLFLGDDAQERGTTAVQVAFRKC